MSSNIARTRVRELVRPMVKADMALARKVLDPSGAIEARAVEGAHAVRAARISPWAWQVIRNASVGCVEHTQPTGDDVGAEEIIGWYDEAVNLLADELLKPPGARLPGDFTEEPEAVDEEAVLRKITRSFADEMVRLQHRSVTGKNGGLRAQAEMALVAVCKVAANTGLYGSTWTDQLLRLTEEHWGGQKTQDRAVHSLTEALLNMAKGGK